GQSISLGRYGRGKAAASGSGGQYVLIWIENEDREMELNPEPVILDQKELQFNPRILAVREDDQVRILNSDPVYHNVFSLSATKRFDVGRRPQGDYLDIVFEKQGVVEVFCDIHSNMHATIYVVSPQTYEWVTEKADEPFSFSSVPPGDYRFNVYAPGFALSTQNITVENGKNLELGTIRLNP
ncbi:MAG: carboxypeptidase regulatory-like domain-containing protein, partial [Balneolales bacterium]